MAQSYSLWVQPRGEVRQQLEEEIMHLAQTHDGPCFEPHVTVLVFEAQDEAEALQVLTLVADRAQPFHMSFQEVSHGSSFYQCVYLLCKPEQMALSLNAIARKQCRRSVAQNPGYMPHLSLLYSDVDEQARHIIVEEEKQRLQWECGALKISGFDVDSIHLWHTPACNCEGWRQVAEHGMGLANAQSQ